MSHTPVQFRCNGPLDHPSSSCSAKGLEGVRGLQLDRKSQDTEAVEWNKNNSPVADWVAKDLLHRPVSLCTNSCPAPHNRSINPLLRNCHITAVARTQSRHFHPPVSHPFGSCNPCYFCLHFASFCHCSHFLTCFFLPLLAILGFHGQFWLLLAAFGCYQLLPAASGQFLPLLATLWATFGEFVLPLLTTWVNFGLLAASWMLLIAFGHVCPFNWTKMAPMHEKMATLQF